ncbi:MAG: hypothetical protein EP343_18685 [Deltaproteobacteria bacterium]|nr:MAG: hypothetical protein EP343_18685 [Deltaproteobacteria bacterium]
MPSLPDIVEPLTHYWMTYLESNGDKQAKAVEVCFSKDLVFVHNDKVLNYDQTLQGSMAAAEGYTYHSITYESLGMYDTLPVNYVWYGRLITDLTSRSTGERKTTDARFTAIFAPRENGTRLYYIQLSPNGALL